MFIVLEIGMLLLAGGHDVDLPRILDAIRAQRIGLVQTEVGEKEGERERGRGRQKNVGGGT